MQLQGISHKTHKIIFNFDAVFIHIHARSSAALICYSTVFQLKNIYYLIKHHLFKQKPQHAEMVTEYLNVTANKTTARAQFKKMYFSS